MPYHTHTPISRNGVGLPVLPPGLSMRLTVGLNLEPEGVLEVQFGLREGWEQGGLGTKDQSGVLSCHGEG